MVREVRNCSTAIVSKFICFSDSLIPPLDVRLCSDITECVTNGFTISITNSLFQMFVVYWCISTRNNLLFNHEVVMFSHLIQKSFVY